MPKKAVATKSGAKTRLSRPGPKVPVYPIGVAARLLDVHPRTLRLYEAEGLVRPQYKGSRRLYSQSDIQWISCLRSMIHDEGISIPGLKRLLALIPCWEINGCPEEVYKNCDARMEVQQEGTTRYCKKCGEPFSSS